MNSSKISLTVAALLGVAAIPAGYGMRALLTKESRPPAGLISSSTSISSQPFDRDSISIPPSEVVTEWKRLQKEYGTNPESMPQLYTHIESLPEGFLKEGLLSVLVTEWVATDARGGFDFFRKRKDGEWRREEAWKTAFLEEWLKTDSSGAIAGVKATGKKWGSHFDNVAIVLAQQAPDFFIDHLDEISLSNAGVSARKEALLILAEHDFVALREAAVAVNSPLRALGIGKAVQVWAAQDWRQAMDWVLAYNGKDEEDVLDAALIGLATVDPVNTLREGGEHLISNRMSASDYIATAGAQDLDGTLSWYFENLSKGIHTYDSAMRPVVSNALSKDPIAFLNRLESLEQFETLAPVFDRMLVGDYDFFYRWQEISRWLNARPESKSKIQLSRVLAETLASQDPPAALQFVDGVTDLELRSRLRKKVAEEIVDSPSLDAANYYRSRYPEWSRAFTLAAFKHWRPSARNTAVLDYPLELGHWTAALEELDGGDFRDATVSLAKAYLPLEPTAALNWVQSIPEEQMTSQRRELTFRRAFANWLWNDEIEALDWSLKEELGPYHDSCADEVVTYLGYRKTPLEEVWPWFESISEARARKKAFGSLKSDYEATSATALSEGLQELDIPEEEKAFYLEQLSQTQSSK